jgi:hypothetical protein
VKFELNTPFESRQATVVVDAGLPAGDHRFQLVVVNAAGVRSAPVEVTVTITRILQPPIDVLTPLQPIQPPIIR